MQKCTADQKYTFIDLFAGAGGLSDGFIQADFDSVAHIEMDIYAAKTLETRLGYYYLKDTDQLSIYHKYMKGEMSRDNFLSYIPKNVLKRVINKKMSSETLPEIYDIVDQLIKDKGIQNIDVIIGGPPCQAYSIVGRAQSTHMEIPMKDDPRNDLYKIYVNFLERYRPKMFVFENVMGIESANGGTTWTHIQEQLKGAGYQINSKEQNARDFGVLQNRRRMVIVGWLNEYDLEYPKFEKKQTNAIVNDILADLPKIHPGESASDYISDDMSEYLKQTKIRESNDILTLHVSRPNKERDIAIYKRAIELWNDGHKRLNYNDLPDDLKTHKNRNSFLDRFKVVEGDLSYCHTMLAHISKDGHYFIHPDIKQHRSITPREAARIQSFADNYYFEGPRTSQFTQIGNAVPPLMAKGIANGLTNELKKMAGNKNNGQ